MEHFRKSYRNLVFFSLLLVFSVYTLDYCLYCLGHIDLIFKIFSNIANICIVLLGLFYYLDKKNIDEINRQQDLRSKIIELLRLEFFSCENQILELVNKGIASKIQIDICRSNILIRFDTLNALLENRELAFSDLQIEKFMQVYSHVEKNYLLMRSSFDEYSNASLEYDKEEIIGKIRAAKVILY